MESSRQPFDTELLVPSASNWYSSSGSDVSPDGRLLAYCANDGVVIVDLLARPRRVLHVLRQHTGKVQSVAFARVSGSRSLGSSASLSDHALISGGADKRLISWDARTGRRLTSATRHSAPITCVCSLPASTAEDAACLSADSAGKVFLWPFGRRSSNPFRLPSLDSLPAVLSMAARPGPGGAAIAALGCEGGRLVIVSVNAARDAATVLAQLQAHPSDVQSVAWLEDAAPPSLMLATGSGLDREANAKIFKVTLGPGAGPPTTADASFFSKINVPRPPPDTISESQRGRLWITVAFAPPHALPPVDPPSFLSSKRNAASASPSAPLPQPWASGNWPVLCVTGYAGAVHVYCIGPVARQAPVLSGRLPGGHTRSVFGVLFPVPARPHHRSDAPGAAPAVELITASMDRSVLIWELGGAAAGAAGPAGASGKGSNGVGASGPGSPRLSLQGDDASPSRSGDPRRSEGNGSGDALRHSTLSLEVSSSTQAGHERERETESQEVESAWAGALPRESIGPGSPEEASGSSAAGPAPPGADALRRLFKRAVVGWTLTGLGGFPYDIEVLKVHLAARLLIGCGDKTIRTVPIDKPSAPPPSKRGGAGADKAAASASPPPPAASPSAAAAPKAAKPAPPSSKVLWVGADQKVTASRACPAAPEVVAAGLEDGSLVLLHTGNQKTLAFRQRADGEITQVAWLDLLSATQRASVSSPWGEEAAGASGKGSAGAADKGKAGQTLFGWGVLTLSAGGQLCLWCASEGETLLSGGGSAGAGASGTTGGVHSEDSGSQRWGRRPDGKAGAAPVDLLPVLRSSARDETGKKLDGATFCRAIALSPDGKCLALALPTGIMAYRLTPTADSTPEASYATYRRASDSAAAAANGSENGIGHVERFHDDPLAAMVVEGARGAADDAPPIHVDDVAFRGHVSGLVSAWAPAGAPVLPPGGASGVSRVAVVDLEGTAFLLVASQGFGKATVAVAAVTASETKVLYEAPAPAAPACASCVVHWRPEALHQGEGRRTGSKSALFAIAGPGELRILEVYPGPDGPAVFRVEGSHQAQSPVRSLAVWCTKKKLSVYMGCEDATIRALDHYLSDLVLQGRREEAPSGAMSDSPALEAGSVPSSSPTVVVKAGAEALEEGNGESSAAYVEESKAAASVDEDRWDRGKRQGAASASANGGSGPSPRPALAADAAAPASASRSVQTSKPSTKSGAPGGSLLGSTSLVSDRGVAPQAADEVRRLALNRIVSLAKVLSGIEDIAATPEAEAASDPGAASLPVFLAVLTAPEPLGAAEEILRDVARVEASLTKKIGPERLRMASRLATLLLWAGNLRGALQIITSHRALTPDLAACILPGLAAFMDPRAAATLPAPDPVSLEASGEAHLAALWHLSRSGPVLASVTAAVDVLIRAGLTRDAVVLAKARLMPGHPLAARAACAELERRGAALSGGAGGAAPEPGSGAARPWLQQAEVAALQLIAGSWVPAYETLVAGASWTDVASGWHFRGLS